MRVQGNTLIGDGDDGGRSPNWKELSLPSFEQILADPFRLAILANK